MRALNQMTGAMDEIDTILNMHLKDYIQVHRHYTTYNPKAWDRLLKQVHKLLEIDHEGETSDGKLTLRYSTCLGACSQGPVFAIDHKLFGKATINKIEKEISEI